MYELRYPPSDPGKTLSRKSKGRFSFFDGQESVVRIKIFSRAANFENFDLVGAVEANLEKRVSRG